MPCLGNIKLFNMTDYYSEQGLSQYFFLQQNKIKLKERGCTNKEYKNKQSIVNRLRVVIEGDGGCALVSNTLQAVLHVSFQSATVFTKHKPDLWIMISYVYMKYYFAIFDL